jgi:hypoxanthine phosphoribosyltransferase
VPAGVAAALERSEVIYDRAAVERAVDQLAIRIALELHDRHPVLVAVMNGGIVIAADLLMRLRFPLEVDYLHVTRYGDDTRGGELDWRALPRTPLAGRTVLLVDDIFDVGTTLAAAVARIQALGALDVRTAVLARKEVSRATAHEPDFVGLGVPDRYVFGRGMDFRGHWRNLPEIRALAAGDEQA